MNFQVLKYPSGREENVVVPRGLPDRNFWHPLEERHEQRTPIDKSLIGKEIRLAQVVVRVGYYFSPMDVDVWDLQEDIKRIVIEQLRNTFSPIPLTEAQLIHAESQIRSEFGTSIDHDAVYQARREWMAKVYQLEKYRPYKGFRTFWYINVCDVDPEASRWFKVGGVKHHKLGWHYPPNSSQSWEGEWDYDPGGLNNCISQSGYLIEGLVGRNYDDYFDSPGRDGYCEAHPLDVLEVREGGVNV